MPHPGLILLDERFLLDFDAPPPVLWEHLRRRLDDTNPERPLDSLQLVLIPFACQLSTRERLLGPPPAGPVSLQLAGALFLRTDEAR